MQSCSDKYIFHKDNHKCQNHAKCQNGQNQGDFLQTDCTEIRYSAHTTMDFKGQEILGGNCGVLNFPKTNEKISLSFGPNI